MHLVAWPVDGADFHLFNFRFIVYQHKLINSICIDAQTRGTLTTGAQHSENQIDSMILERDRHADRQSVRRTERNTLKLLNQIIISLLHGDCVSITILAGKHKKCANFRLT